MNVIIYQPSQNAMQSGTGKTQQWVLRFDETERAEQDPLMGWTGMSDTLQELRLSFDSLEEATHYADAKGYRYEVAQKSKPKIVPKNYAANFSFYRQPL